MEWEAIPVFPNLLLPEAPGLPDAVLEVPMPTTTIMTTAATTAFISVAATLLGQSLLST